MVLTVQDLNQGTFHLRYRKVSACFRPTTFYLELQFKMADPFIASTADLFREFPIKVLHLDSDGFIKVCAHLLSHHYFNLKGRSLHFFISNRTSV